MAETRVAITGLARDVGRILPLTIRRVEHLANCFADARVVVFENDSRDDTRLLLCRWAGDDPRVDVTSERLDDPVNPTTRCLDRAPGWRSTGGGARSGCSNSARGSTR